MIILGSLESSLWIFC